MTADKTRPPHHHCLLVYSLIIKTAQLKLEYQLHNDQEESPKLPNFDEPYSRRHISRLICSRCTNIYFKIDSSCAVLVSPLIFCHLQKTAQAALWMNELRKLKNKFIQKSYLWASVMSQSVMPVILGGEFNFFNVLSHVPGLNCGRKLFFKHNGARFLGKSLYLVFLMGELNKTSFPPRQKPRWPSAYTPFSLLFPANL